MNLPEYLKMAYRLAAHNSPDPSTQNAALLINGSGLLMAQGVNEFPPGVQYTEERWQRPLKYSYIEHAERNCIYAAAKKGVKTKGMTLICPFFACADCARAIVCAGIREVIGHDHPLQKDNPRWKESVLIGDQILTEGGVKFTRIKAELGVPFRYNEQLVMS